MNRRLLRLVASLLIVISPSSLLMAEVAPAVVNSAGSVTVDGKSVNQGTAVFSGQAIRTGSDSSAILNFQGASVALAPETTASPGRNSVDLGCGTAQVATNSGMLELHAGSAVIRAAASQPARYIVTSTASGLQISAQQGSLQLVSASGTQTIAPGAMITAPATGACFNDQSSDRRDAPPAAAGQSHGGAVLIGLAAAGAAAALVILTTRSSSAKNP